MAKQFAVLEWIENNHQITKDTDNEFLFQLQLGLLLALKEHGRLNEMQRRYAQEKLDKQRQEWFKKKGERK